MAGLLSKVGDVMFASKDAMGEWFGAAVERSGLSEKQFKIGAGVLAGGLLSWKLFLAGPSNLPPGPRRMPLIGTLHNMGKNECFYLVFEDLKQKYGDIVTVSLGPKLCIVLNSPDLVREAYIRQGLATANRPYFHMFEVFSEGGQDMFASTEYSPRVQIQRKLAHQALRKFSAGDALEGYLTSAFQQLEAELDKHSTFKGPDMGFLIAYNILASMCFGKSFAFDDPFFQEMVASTKQQEDLFEQFGLSDVLPIMRFFPSKIGRIMKDFMALFNSYFDATYQEHIDSYNPEKLTDFTYHLIHAMKEAENDPNDRNAAKLLTQKHFTMILVDLFFAGTDTTRMTLNWVWHYLAAYPDIQKKAQEEVDSVIGADGNVTANCREQLPYVDAILHEVMRIKPVAPMGVFHETAEPMKLAGYDIPKGTMVMANTWSIHMDPKSWSNPDAFLPERWLDSNGRYVFQQNGFLPFSVGRRSCVGESFAKLELHMLTTMMLQKYTIMPEPGHWVSLQLAPSMVVKPIDQKLVAQRRK